MQPVASSLVLWQYTVFPDIVVVPNLTTAGSTNDF